MMIAWMLWNVACSDSEEAMSSVGLVGLREQAEAGKNKRILAVMIYTLARFCGYLMDESGKVTSRVHGSERLTGQVKQYEECMMNLDERACKVMDLDKKVLGESFEPKNLNLREIQALERVIREKEFSKRSGREDINIAIRDYLEPMCSEFKNWNPAIIESFTMVSNKYGSSSLRVEFEGNPINDITYEIILCMSSFIHKLKGLGLVKFKSLSY